MDDFLAAYYAQQLQRHDRLRQMYARVAATPFEDVDSILAELPAGAQNALRILVREYLRREILAISDSINTKVPRPAPPALETKELSATVENLLSESFAY